MSAREEVLIELEGFALELAHTAGGIAEASRGGTATAALPRLATFGARLGAALIDGLVGGPTTATGATSANASITHSTPA